MTGNLIRAIGEICSTLHPDYRFEYDEASAMNIKADAIHNYEGLIFMEEIQQGRYDMPGTGMRFFRQKNTNVSIYFCRFSRTLNEFGGSGQTSESERNLTLTRQEIRDRIECEVVLPFMESMDSYQKSKSSTISINSYNFVYPPHSRFDSNEVAIILNFTITQYQTCLGNL